MKSDTRANLWRERMSACKSSGLSVTEYCRQNGLRARGYYYWKLRLAKTDDCTSAPTSSSDPNSTWLCVETETVQPASQRQSLTVKICGAEIEVGPDFNAVLLRSVVHALGAQP